MKKVKYIIFDFDSTLVDSLKYWYKAIDKEAFKHFKIKSRKGFPEARSGLTNREIYKCFVEFSKTTISPKEVADFWYDTMINNYKTKIKVIAGAKEYLEELKNKEYKLVLASATPLRVLNFALNHFGLKKYFEHIVTEESIKEPKREPDFYVKLLEKLGITQKEIFVFEDSFVSLKAANGVGIKTCAIKHSINKSKLKNLGENNLLVIKNYKSKKLKKLCI